jgi:glutamyl-tRNA synthetase
VADGRFAPSPSGPLHLGSLRTALVAWLFARSAGSRFWLRVDDLDPASSRPETAAGHLADLSALGLEWDEPVWYQSAHSAEHHAAVDALVDRGLTYPCWCTRREVADAARAPNRPGHGPEGAYPGTCATLSSAQQAERVASGRPAALRLRADGAVVSFTDRLHGRVEGTVDDFVVRRNDGVVAYNVAVVVDDAAQGVAEVVRGDDLLDSTPRQIHLSRLLGLAVPSHAHVPLVLGSDGVRLAKRHGAITLGDLAARGHDAVAVRAALARSLGLATSSEADRDLTLDVVLSRFDPDALPREPWMLPPGEDVLTTP